MRLGFIGVGKWSQKLATAFRACGAEIVAYDRKQGPRGGYGGVDVLLHPPEPAPGFGRYQPWRNQLADKSIDAIIAVAPPEVTTEVALACIESGKPVLATKPLFRHPDSIKSVAYVDFWRLWSESHRRAHDLFTNDVSGQPLCIALYGSGPIRDFPGAFDYGTHVLAAMYDIAPDCTITSAKRVPCEQGEFFTVEAEQDGKKIIASFGNGAKGSSRCIGMPPFNLSFEEGTMIGDETKDDVLRRFAASFILDVQEGHVNPHWMNLSRRATEEIRRIRETAT